MNCSCLHEIEKLRGETISLVDIKPEEIPCRETSDTVRLCREPIVSVFVTTYNQERYIGKTIESILSQKTNFEFEIVIGEDCSADTTREICFEYQRKFPERIRVLWWDKNVSKCGGNWRRCQSRCRADLIAVCEGDDYWVDPLKLQKQVDVFRACPMVGLCYTDNFCYDEQRGKLFSRNYKRPKEGVVAGDEFLVKYAIGEFGWGATASVMYRRSVLDKAVLSRFGEISKWDLRLADRTLFLLCASVSDVYYLAEKMVTYREGVGVMTRDSFGVGLDSACVSYFFLKVLGTYDNERLMIRNQALSYRYRRLPWLRYFRRVVDAMGMLSESESSLAFRRKMVILSFLIPGICEILVRPIILFKRRKRSEG